MDTRTELQTDGQNDSNIPPHPYLGGGQGEGGKGYNKKATVVSWYLIDLLVYQMNLFEGGGCSSFFFLSFFSITVYNFMIQNKAYVHIISHVICVFSSVGTTVNSFSQNFHYGLYSSNRNRNWRKWLGSTWALGATRPLAVPHWSLSVPTPIPNWNDMLYQKCPPCSTMSAKRCVPQNCSQSTSNVAEPCEFGHGSGMSCTTTSCQKPSSRAPWRVDFHQRKCWMDNIKESASLPMPELLIMASHRKDWRRISADLSVTSPQQPNCSEVS